MAPALVLLAAVAHLAQAWPSPANNDAAQQPVIQKHTQGYEFDPLLHLPGISP